MKVYDKVDILGKDKLSIGEHSTYHRRTISFIEAITISHLGITEEMFNKYKAAHDAEQNIIRMQKGYAETQVIQEKDAERDDLFRYVIGLVKSAAKAPLLDVKEAGMILLPIVKPYSNSMNLSYSRQAADIIGMTKDLSNPEYASYVAVISNLSTALDALNSVNDQCELLIQRRTAEAALLPTAADSRAAREATDALYDEIIEWANGAVRYLPSPELNTFIADMNQLIDETRAAYNRRMGRIHANSDKKPDTDKPIPDQPDHPEPDPDLPAPDPDLPA